LPIWGVGGWDNLADRLNINPINALVYLFNCIKVIC